VRIRLVGPLVGAFAMVGAAPAAHGSTVQEIQITNSTTDQFDPAVSRGKIAWTDMRNGNPDIYVYDVATGVETQVVSDPAAQVLADLDGTTVVYTDYRNLDGSGNPQADIYVYDLTTGKETRVTTDLKDQLDPAISGTRLVWDDRRSGSLDIWGGNTDGTGEVLVTNAANPQDRPRISGNVAVWEDLRNGNYDVYGYDFTTHAELAIATGASNASRPDIDGNHVVYQDDRNGNLDIYLYDLVTHVETRLTTEAHDQRNPRISGNAVVWEDLRNVDIDLYGFDLATMTEHPVATGPSNQYLHDIDGPDIAFTDDRNGNLDIYLLHTIETPTDPCDPASGAFVYFDKTYTRHHGGPETVVSEFNAPSTLAAGTMCVGVDRVASAEIGLNLKPIFGPSDFHDGLTSLETTVPLRERNLVAVELEGAPGDCHCGDSGDEDGDGHHHVIHARGGSNGHGDGNGDGDDGDDDGNGSGGSAPCVGTLRVRIVGPLPAPPATCTVAPAGMPGAGTPSISLFLLAGACVLPWARRRR
jgi:TolB protein